jgi:hypothetical protein
MNSRLYWKRGDPIRATQLNELAARSVPSVSPAAGMNAKRMPSGELLIGMNRPQVGVDTFTAILTGSSLLSGHAARWSYTFEQCYLTVAGGVLSATAMSNGITGSAYNLIELAHIAEPGSDTPWYVWGINCHDAAIGATLTPCPVGGGSPGGGHEVDVPVRMTRRCTSGGGNIIYTFEGWGSVHVACT